MLILLFVALALWAAGFLLLDRLGACPPRLTCGRFNLETAIDLNRRQRRKQRDKDFGRVAEG